MHEEFGHEHEHDSEHAHEHTHSHEHTHADGQTHTHEHSHAHTHEHEHDHEHTHSDADRRLALLKYMLDHNTHHAEELLESAAGLEEAGKADAAALIREGVEKMNEGNNKLAAAIGLLERKENG